MLTMLALMIGKVLAVLLVAKVVFADVSPNRVRGM